MPFRIEGFPEPIAEVPETPREWLIWRGQVLAFRELIHRVANDSLEQRAAVVAMAARDPAFFMAVFGVLFDPKGEPDLRINDETGEIEVMEKPPGWYPWIPYPFQVETIRWYQDVRRHGHGSKGRGDGVVEKSRDMGITWTFCLIAAHSWLFDDDSTFGLISHKEELVRDDSQKGMLFKVKATLGVKGRVPERCFAPGTPYDTVPTRIPDWMIPAGFEPKLHSFSLSLRHPSKMNQITGESTTSKSGIGDRQGAVFIDEGAKNDKLLDIWTGLAAVTHHRFVFSSADRQYGDGMYTLADRGRKALANPNLTGPSFLSLPYDRHPLRDGERWLEAEHARFDGTEAAFNREYLIDWNAGAGDWVYPTAAKIIPGYYPYDPLAGDVTVTIDPGLRDPTAIQFYQNLPGTNGEHALFDAITLQVDSAEYLTPILMGWPPGHEVRLRPDYFETSGQSDIQDIIDIMWELRSKGRTVHFVGDPYGDNAGGANSQSFYTTMYLTSVELNSAYPDLPPFRIAVKTKYDEGARFHRARKEALTRLIPRIRFNDTLRVRYVVDALKEHRYKSLNPNQTAQNEPNSPVHDWTCLHGDTAIRTTSGWVPIRDLVGRDDVWLWGYSERERRLVPAKASRIWKSGENAPLVEVTLDNGATIRSTPEHRFMLRNGEWCEAQALQPGTSLMPFYDHNNRGYTRVRLNDGSTADEHVFVYTRVNGMPNEGCHIHHKDGNKRNNDPGNLEMLTKEEHCRITRPQKGGTTDEKNYRFLTAKKYTKVCPLCGEEFIGSYKQTWCSKECSREAAAASRRIARGIELQTVTCVICHEEFETYDSRRKTCSDECQKRHHQNQVNESARRTRAKKAVASSILNHKVVAVRRLDETADVYDICVPETNSFVAEGVVVHNSHHASAAEYMAVSAKTADFMAMPNLKPSKTNARNRNKRMGWENTWTR